jgi:23S rRNA-/tRNA-specific pseudouridylate synthase
MFQTIQKIVAIFSGYGNGKLLEKKKGKTGKKLKVKDVVSISEEARKRINANGNEIKLPYEDKSLYVIDRSGD